MRKNSVVQVALVVSALLLASCSEASSGGTPFDATPEPPQQDQPGDPEAPPADPTTPAESEASPDPEPETPPPTPGIFCCITTVFVDWSGPVDLEVPAAWQFDAATTCGTVGELVEVPTNGTQAGDGSGSASSTDAAGCDITITWRAVDGWQVAEGSSRTILGGAVGEFDFVNFVLTAAP